jgi:hypothetical protein
MNGIFISYRREDSAGWTGRLVERLRETFGGGSIFMDIDTIEPGADFTEALQKAVGACDVLVAVIGPEWATTTEINGKRRLENPSDWIRIELATALKRNIRVIPVLMGGASLPAVDLLPDELASLAHRQAHELTDKRWSYDVEQLLRTLPAARQKPPIRPEGSHPLPSLWRSEPVVIGSLVAVAAVAAWISLQSFNAFAPSRGTVAPTSLPRTSEGPPPRAGVNQTASSAILSTIHLQAGQEARLKNNRGTCVYKVLALQLERSRPNTFTLSVTVRVTNDGPLDNAFGDGNFRLLVDDVPRAPTSNLIDTVQPHSAKEGTVDFACRPRRHGSSCKFVSRRTSLSFRWT